MKAQITGGIFVSVLLAFLFRCDAIWVSAYDPSSPGFIEPSFTIDTARTAVVSGDTTFADSVYFTLRGNDFGNLFRWRLDSLAWSPWEGRGQSGVTFAFDSVDTGEHAVVVETCYDTSTVIVKSTMRFYRVSPPWALTLSDTLLRIKEHASCTLRVRAGGSGALRMQWYHDGDSIADATNETLIIPSCVQADAGMYYLVITSAYGTAWSDSIHLVVKPQDVATFKITYAAAEKDSGLTPTDNNVYEQGEFATVKGNDGGLFRTGYAFSGWNTAQDGAGMAYDPGDLLTVGNADLTLHAQWTLIPTFRIFYDANGSSGGEVPVDDSGYVEYAEIRVAGNAGNLVRNGYTFAGWNTTASGDGAAYAGGAIMTMGDDDVTLYAQWTQKPTYSVTYSGNGHTDGEAPVDENNYEQGAQVDVARKPDLFSRSGYAFTGWNTAADGTGASYAGGAHLIMNSTDMVLYAQWTRNPTYMVSYDDNGGEDGNAPDDNNNYEQGAAVQVAKKPAALVRPGFSFAGWNTAANGGGATYDEGDTLVMGDSDVILYAQWSENPTFTIVYDGNGNTAGTPPVDNDEYEEGETATVAGNTDGLNRSGHSFAGWNSAADGSGQSYESGSLLTIGTINVRLYAQWTVNPTFAVVYSAQNADDGSVPVDSAMYEQGALVHVRGNSGALKRAGYTFTGWNTASDAAGERYAGGETFVMASADVTLYAQWTRNPTYSVMYDKNGALTGAAPIDDNNYEQGAQAVIANNTGALERSGYTFAGWNTSANGSGAAYAGGAKMVIGASDVTLYAQWTQNPTWNVTYAGNGHTGGAAPIDINEYEQGATVTVEGNSGALERTGYTFGGWNTAADGGGAALLAEDTFTMGETDIVLYAQWEIDTYTVTFNSNGGSAVSSQKVAYNDRAIEPEAPVKANHQFGGWHTSTALTAEFDFTTPITASRALHAKWIPVFSVIYHANGGLGSVPEDARAYTNGQTVTILSGSGLSRNGYLFAGWNTQADTLGAQYAPGETFAVGAMDVDLYAKWRLDAVEIVTHPGDQSVTEGHFATLSIEAYGAEMLYQWQKNGEDIEGATASTYSTPELGVSNNGDAYRCIVKNAVNSVTSAEASIKILTEPVVDIDGNAYPTIVLGNQVWTTVSLRVTRYNDGTPIRHVTSTDSAHHWYDAINPFGAYCFYDNTEDVVEQETYGALYNYYAVYSGDLAPDGWHVPLDSDWDALAVYLGTHGYNWDNSNYVNKAAKALAATTGWRETDIEGTPGHDPHLNNSTGFTAYASGGRSQYSFYGKTSGCLLWAITADSSNVYEIYYGRDSLKNVAMRHPLSNDGGWSVRLIRD
jgi:uncharacterized protein (TIGR02145 family)/uncharacterized repeat protein (TIGR02543 family)